MLVPGLPELGAFDHAKRKALSDGTQLLAVGDRPNAVDSINTSSRSVRLLVNSRVAGFPSGIGQNMDWHAARFHSTDGWNAHNTSRIDGGTPGMSGVADQVFSGQAAGAPSVTVQANGILGHSAPDAVGHGGDLCPIADSEIGRCRSLSTD